MSRTDSTANAASMSSDAPLSIFTSHDDPIETVDNLSNDVWGSWRASRITDASNGNVVYLPVRSPDAAVMFGELTIEGLSDVDGETAGRMFQNKLVDLMADLIIGIDTLQQTPEHLSDEQAQDFVEWLDLNMPNTPMLIEEQLRSRGASQTAFDVMQKITGEFVNAPSLIGTVQDSSDAATDEEPADQTIVIDGAPYMSTANAVL